MSTRICSVYVKNDPRVSFSGFDPPGKFERLMHEHDISDIRAVPFLVVSLSSISNLCGESDPFKAQRKESLLATHELLYYFKIVQ